MLSIIAAMAKNNVIGKNGRIPWHISEDYINFSKKTKGHPVIMGRKTHESISGFQNLKGWDKNSEEKTLIPKTLHKLLPGRTNIIVTRQLDYKVPGGIVVNSIEKAVEKAKRHAGSEEVFIIGGAELYKLTIDMVDKVYITLIDEEVEGDVFFPEFVDKFDLKEENKRVVSVNNKEIRYNFKIYGKSKE